MAWNPEDFVSPEVQAEIGRLDAEATPGRELPELADEIENSDGLYRLGSKLGEHQGYQLGIKKTAQVVAALRLAATSPDRDSMNERRIAEDTRLASNVREATVRELAGCMLLNQIEIMGAVSLLLRYARPGLIGKAGELDQQRDDLLRRHKATQAALSTTGKPKR